MRIPTTWALFTIIATALAVAVYAQSDTTILSGKQPPQSFYLHPESGTSPMLRSQTTRSTTIPARLRLLGVRVPVAGEAPAIELRFAVLDSSGNAIIGISDTTYQQWETHLVTADGYQYRDSVTPTLRSSVWITARLRVALVLEHSLISAPYRLLLAQALNAFRTALGPYDSLSIIGAGVQPKLLVPMTLRDSLPIDLAQVAQQIPFTGVNRLSYGILAALEEAAPSVVIVLTACDDHASLDVVTRDIIEKAIRDNTRVYTIAIGDNIETGPLELIAAHTGGAFYRFYTTYPEQLRSAVHEIIRGEQVASTAVFSLPTSVQVVTNGGCILTLRCRYAGTTLSDSLTLPPSSALNPTRQILAVFSERSSALDPTTAPIIEALAELLRSNPAQAIELVGHSFKEGTPTQQAALAVRRARAVKDAIVAAGISAKRIRIRAMGDLKPLYPAAETPTELAFNRRVELRWLDPSLLPYELVAGYTYSEQEALSMVQEWEQRGYRAYIEDVLLHGRAALRIKLWGYATRQEAIAAANDIARRYRAVITIE